jgi:hypothetical protein
MEYWTRNNFILCTKCRAVIEVEPTVSQEGVIEITSEEAQQRLKPGVYVDGVEIFAEVKGMSNTDWHDYLYKNKIIFIDDEFDGEDTWLVYYEDEELTKRIDDIDQFIEDYKNKVEVIEVKA